MREDVGPARGLATNRQILLPTRDNGPRSAVAGAFAADTTWAHCCPLRPRFETVSLPAASHPAGRSRFGHTPPLRPPAPVVPFSKMALASAPVPELSAISLQLESPRCSRRWRGWKPVLTGVMLLGFLLAQAVALSHDLHLWLHGDASAPGHVCAAVVLQQDAVESTAAGTMVVRPPNPDGHPALRPFVVPKAFRTAEPPGRGPPRF